MVTRCLQSSGSSGTIALSVATVSDIVTSAERGTYVSYVQLGWMVGPALGPVGPPVSIVICRDATDSAKQQVIGGILSQYFGWRSIFWFLTTYSSVILAICLLFLPETSRKVCGNGSIPAQKWNGPLLSYLRNQKQHNDLTKTDKKLSPAHKAKLNPLSSLKLFLDLESSILLLYGGLIYSTTYFILSTLPPQLQSKYTFNTLQISLCYLATGGGTTLATLLIGRLLDRNFRRHALRLGLSISTNKQQPLHAFPIEQARLQVSLPFLVFAGVSLVAYGWAMAAEQPDGRPLPLAAPLVLLFLAAFATSCAYAGFNNLVVDLNRDRPGTAAAAMNLARCWIGALGVAFANPLVDAVGMGWGNMVPVGFWVAFCPLVLWVMRCGEGWRGGRGRVEGGNGGVST